jgi:hypothetical protein
VTKGVTGSADISGEDHDLPIGTELHAATLGRVGNGRRTGAGVRGGTSGWLLGAEQGTSPPEGSQGGCHWKYPNAKVWISYVGVGNYISAAQFARRGPARRCDGTEGVGKESSRLSGDGDTRQGRDAWVPVPAHELHGAKPDRLFAALGKQPDKSLGTATGNRALVPAVVGTNGPTHLADVGPRLVESRVSTNAKKPQGAGTDAAAGTGATASYSVEPGAAHKVWRSSALRRSEGY